MYLLYLRVIAKEINWKTIRPVSTHVSSNRLYSCYIELKNMNKKEVDEQLMKLQLCIDKILHLLGRMEQVLSAKENDGIDSWISEAQVQELTGLSSSTLYELRRTKQVLSSYITPKAIVYNKKSLVKLIEKNARK